MLTEAQYTEIRDELMGCKKPLFLYHNDPDGLSSFLLLYRFAGAGKGVVVKKTPIINSGFIRRVEEYGADKVFILDIAVVEQEFIDGAGVPVIWIDHHSPLKRSNVKYYNPRIQNENDNIPASYICYKVAQKDLWIGMVGMAGDWFVPEFADEFSHDHPSLLPEGIRSPGDVLFKTKLGELARIFAFVLQGKTEDAYKCTKILTRINSPEEILDGLTPAAEFLNRRYRAILRDYTELIEDASKNQGNGKLLVYTYPSTKMSFTGELSNEMLFRNPKKVIIIARSKSGEMKASLRSPADINIQPILKYALEGVDGYGGGHEHAGGVCIKDADWEKFLDKVRQQLPK